MVAIKTSWLVRRYFMQLGDWEGTVDASEIR